MNNKNDIDIVDMSHSTNPPFKHTLRPLTPWQKIKSGFDRFERLFDEYFGGFLENASIHGLSYLKSSNHSKFKFLWISVIIFQVGAVCWLSLLLMRRFREQPLRMTIRSFQTSTESIDFPAVTICDNTLQDDEMNAFLEKLNYKDDIKPSDVRKAIPKMMSRFDNLDDMKPLGGKLEKLHKILTLNELTIRDVLARLATRCDRTLIYCRLGSQTIPCGRIFEATTTGYGFCCTFNALQARSKFETFKSANVGAFSGLSLVVDQKTDFLNGFVKIFIHNNDRLPWVTAASIMYYITPFSGHLTLIPIDIEKMNISSAVENLPMESRRCVLKDEISLQHFSEYQPINCMIECAVNASLQLCGCAPYNTPVGDERVCTLLDMPCLNRHYGVIYAVELVRDDPDLENDLKFVQNGRTISACPCWNKCSDLIYLPKPDIVPLNAVDFEMFPISYTPGQRQH